MADATESPPQDVPVRTEDAADALARLARSLGVDEAKVGAALAATRMTPAQAFDAILHGRDDAQIEKLAKELHVSRPRLALALLDGAVQQTSQLAGAVTPTLREKAMDAASRAKDWAFEVVEFTLETFAETIPRILNRITLALVLTGLVFTGMGVLALVDQALFLKIVWYVVGAMMTLFGLTLVYVAWRIHEATATIRTVARLAKKWRSRWNAWTLRDDP
jgi:hypothetical protein